MPFCSLDVHSQRLYTHDVAFLPGPRRAISVILTISLVCHSFSTTTVAILHQLWLLFTFLAIFRKLQKCNCSVFKATLQIILCYVYNGFLNSFHDVRAKNAKVSTCHYHSAWLYWWFNDRSSKKTSCTNTCSLFRLLAQNLWLSKLVICKLRRISYVYLMFFSR